MSEQMVVLVTGANRGIGLAICESILSSPQPVKLYAASRSGTDLRLKPQTSSTIVYPKLDVTKQSTIDDLVQRIRDDDKHVDVLINNAGLNTLPSHTLEDAKQMLDVNYRGTLHMCESILPLLSKKGRIVNLSSVGSILQKYSPTIQSRFRDHKMTLSDLEDIAKDYEEAVSAGQESARGFGKSGQGYSVSKSCVNGLTAVLARENEGLAINACCPGWVATDMGSLVGKPPKSPAEGAKIPVRLGFGDIGGVTGRYWSNDGIADKGDGRVQEW